MNFIFGPLFFLVFGFLLSRILKRNDVADPLWSLGFLAGSIFSVWNLPSLHLRQMTILLLVGIWALRLSQHLWRRILSHPQEDKRYKAWRDNWKSSEALNAFVRVFSVQALLLLVSSINLNFALSSEQATISLIDVLGAMLAMVGFLLESTADSELVQFKKEKHLLNLKILNTGVWSWCRHPNYLGEILFWWGIFLLTWQSSAPLWTIVSPLLISFLLIKVSGVPLLEKQFLKEKGAEMREYILKTPALIPLRLEHVLSVFLVALTAFVLDQIWIGKVAATIYNSGLSEIGRITNGQWQPPLGAAGIVYILIGAGIRYFCAHEIKLPACGLKGALWGLNVYGIYELTNLALIRSWPMEVVLIDITWGAILGWLCAATMFFSRKIFRAI